jgi:serine/threonine protein kinase
MSVSRDAAPIPVASLPPFLDGYRIVEWLGEGGMGRVLRAVNMRTNAWAAIKLPRDRHAGQIASLVQEGTTLKRLRHPGIVRWLAEGTWDGLPWLALELLEGRTLLDIMEPNTGDWDSGRTSVRQKASQQMTALAGGDLSRPARSAPRRRPFVPQLGRLQEITLIFTDLAGVLDHLHGHGLVHRDLKPANIFLRAGGSVTLLDFGLACPANAPRPPNADRHPCVGTMQYAAPEQIRGDPVDARSDVYALGCILYELVTGLPPFEGDSANAVAQQHLHAQPIAPTRFVPEIPWKLHELLLDMLAKRPDARPFSAGIAAARLARAAHGVQSSERDVNPGSRAAGDQAEWRRPWPVRPFAGEVCRKNPAG